MTKTMIAAVLVVFSTAYLQYVLGGGKEILTLYENRDYKGKKCELEVKGCIPVCDFMDNKASSLTWNGTCTVNLYKEPNCKEWAVGWNASYGGISDFKGLNYQDIISSVGDCHQAIESKRARSGGQCFHTGVIDLTAKTANDLTRTLQIFALRQMLISKKNKMTTVYLYEHSYFGGKKCEIKIDQPCKNVCDNMKRKASSMDGAACVKLFKDTDCKNYASQYDLMRGAVQNLKGTKSQDIVMSVSRC